MTDFARAWMDCSLIVKLHFHLLFGVAVVTLVRAARLCVARYCPPRTPTDAEASETTSAEDVRRRHTASILVRSTRGLASASLLLCGGAAATALNDALIVFGTTGRSSVDIMIEQHRGAVTLIPASLGLCSFVYAVGILLEALLHGWPPLPRQRARLGRGTCTLIASTDDSGLGAPWRPDGLARAGVRETGAQGDVA